MKRSETDAASPRSRPRQHRSPRRAIETENARRRRIEAALRQSEAQLRALFELQELILQSAGEGILGLDLAGKMTFVNAAAAKMLGYRVEELLGRASHALWHHSKPDGSPYPESDCPILASYRDGQTHHQNEEVFWRKDGSRFSVEYLSTPIHEGPKLGGAVVVFRDITARKRLEKQILDAGESERNRIGQDLHDGLCQTLAGIEFRLQTLRIRLARKSRPESASVAEIGRLTRQAIEETRRLARGLSPVALRADGLMAALQELATGAEELFRIRCEFRCHAPVLFPDSTVASHLFRIAQEAVTNAVKHGRAKRILLELMRTGERIVLSVRDNGTGFNKLPFHHQGMGLRVMQYRAGVIGGQLEVSTVREAGTVVRCSLKAPGGDAR